MLTHTETQVTHAVYTSGERKLLLLMRHKREESRRDHGYLDKKVETRGANLRDQITNFILGK